MSGSRRTSFGAECLVGGRSGAHGSGLPVLLHHAGVWSGRQIWGLLLVIPGAGAAATATSLYRAAGSRATTAVLGTATGAATLAFIAVMLLLDLDWGLLRPMFLIIPGLVTLIGACAPPAADAAEHSGSMA